MRRLFYTLSVCATLASAPTLADDTPAPFPDFTFKRVTAPGAGVPGAPAGARRITVQIDPAEQAAALEVQKQEAMAQKLAEQTAPVSTKWDWFWDDVSSRLADSGPANVSSALKLLSTRGDVPQPRLQHLQAIAKVHGTDILKATIGTPVSPALVLALISVESAGKTDAESHAGAQGLMQLIPETAARFGVEDSTNPSQNIKGGVAYLDWLMNHFQGDAIMALAGYNAGENAVTKNEGVPPYAETRAYVPKVLAAWQVARGLCLTPPELLSDGCVFAVNGVHSSG